MENNNYKSIRFGYYKNKIIVYDSSKPDFYVIGYIYANRDIKLFEDVSKRVYFLIYNYAKNTNYKKDYTGENFFKTDVSRNNYYITNKSKPIHKAIQDIDFEDFIIPKATIKELKNTINTLNLKEHSVYVFDKFYDISSFRLVNKKS